MFYLLKKSLKGLPAGARTGNALISRSAQDMPSCKPAIQNNRQGYSLVELLIVVAIIATIAAIAIPSYSEMVNTAYVVAAIGDIKKIQYDIEWYYVVTEASRNLLRRQKLRSVWIHGASLISI